jgi:hypothetical protein
MFTKLRIRERTYDTLHRYVDRYISKFNAQYRYNINDAIHIILYKLNSTVQ